MKCPKCNKEFSKTSNRQIYCSKLCNRQSDKSKARRRKYEQSKKGRETKKKYLQKIRKKPEIKLCVQCNKEFISKRSHGKYCSPKCYTKSDTYKEKDKKRNSDPKRKENVKKRRGTTHFKQQQLAYQKTDKQKAYRRKRDKQRRESEPLFRLKKSMGARLRGFIKKKGNIKKTNKTFTIVGCTPEFLKKHLEKQFYPNPTTSEPMTWKNHSLTGWHVDHIIPLDQAETTEDFKKLSHYTNLQPLWSKENIKKSNKI